MFTRFSKLPLELRIMIWEYAANLPRNIDILSNVIRVDENPYNFKCGHVFGYSTTQPIPSILLANKESKEVGLRYYSLGFVDHVVYFAQDSTRPTTVPQGSRRSTRQQAQKQQRVRECRPRIWFNCRADRVCLMGEMMEEAYHKDFWGCGRLRSIAIDIASLLKDTHFFQILDNFPQTSFGEWPMDAFAENTLAANISDSEIILFCSSSPQRKYGMRGLEFNDIVDHEDLPNKVERLLDLMKRSVEISFRRCWAKGKRELAFDSLRLPTVKFAKLVKEASVQGIESGDSNRRSSGGKEIKRRK